MKKPTIVIDFDAILFKSCCAVEKRSVKIINKITQEEFIRKNISSFWGRGKNIGGELREINSKKDSPYTKDDFLVVPQQEVDDFKNAICILNNTINSFCSLTNTTKWYGYVGGVGNFRIDEAQLIPYKQNRENLIKPIYYDQMKDHMLNKVGIFSVNGKEVDDQISTDCYDSYRNWKKTGKEQDKLIAVVSDKDYKGCLGWFYYPDFDFEPTLIEGLGEISLNDDKVHGAGRAWKYFQFFGDQTDGFSANYHSDKPFGTISAYRALDGCRTDKEYFESIVKTYKELYPVSKEIENFRGDLVQVSWLSMLQENVLFAHLERWEGDRLDVKSILDNLEVQYDD